MRFMSLQNLIRWRAVAFAVTGLLVMILAFGGNPAQAEMPPDYDIPGGHFFTQGAPAGSPAGSGFGVTDDQGIPFWSTYQDEGGLLRMGYPLSGRFLRDGLVTQVMQKAVFQWHPGARVVEFVNVLDEHAVHVFRAGGFLAILPGEIDGGARQQHRAAGNESRETVKWAIVLVILRHVILSS